METMLARRTCRVGGRRADHQGRTGGEGCCPLSPLPGGWFEVRRSFELLAPEPEAALASSSLFAADFRLTVCELWKELTVIKPWPCSRGTSCSRGAACSRCAGEAGRRRVGGVGDTGDTTASSSGFPSPVAQAFLLPERELPICGVRPERGGGDLLERWTCSGGSWSCGTSSGTWEGN